jgi:hypothetical protein
MVGQLIIDKKQSQHGVTPWWPETSEYIQKGKSKGEQVSEESRGLKHISLQDLNDKFLKIKNIWDESKRRIKNWTSSAFLFVKSLFSFQKKFFFNCESAFSVL